MTQFPDCNVKPDYLQGPAYWDMPYETPFCYHRTASANTSHFAALGFSKELDAPAEAWPWATGLFLSLLFTEMCSATRRTQYSDRRQGVRSVIVGYISSCFKHLRWLPWQSAERPGHPPKGIHLVWRWRLNLLQSLWTWHLSYYLLGKLNLESTNISRDISSSSCMPLVFTLYQNPVVAACSSYSTKKLK